MEEAPDNEDWAQGVSFVYTRLGDLDIKSNLASALKNYQGSLAIAAKYFYRRSADYRWQRELSWAFNKVGDVRVLNGDASARAGDLAGKRAEYSAALAAFNNSLCLRRQISAAAPTRTEFTRDVTFTLDRVGGALRQLDDAAEAELAYFEALAIRRGLVNSVPDNALYLGDVATSLQSIGELYLGRQDLKGGLAFYEAAVDVRLQVTLLSPPTSARART